MEDLDSLLEDLGRGKSAPSVRKERPPSSRVDLNELEDLMEDLAAPTARATHATPKPEPVKMPAAAPQPAPVPAAEPAGGGDDDLDALMASLSATSSRTTPTAAAPPKPAPVVAAPPVAAPPVIAPQAPVQAPPKPAAQPAYNPGPAAPLNPTPISQPAGSSDLDALLGNLSQQMASIDSTNPASRGTCGTCGQPILGEVITALGRTFHPEHFVCATCRSPLGSAQFFELNGQCVCQRCNSDAHSEKCGHCNQPVAGRVINALGKKWHPEHFICTQCTQPFAGGQFFERDGKPYCETDFYDLFAPKCGQCNQAIRGDCINALGKQWHPEHFACSTCGKDFGNGSFFEHAGMPYCDQHYHNQTGSLCGGCNKPITDRAINALGKKWHPEHFVCAFCMNPLNGQNFSEANGKAYCGECHGKLFSS
jgi:paxillin